VETKLFALHKKTATRRMVTKKEPRPILFPREVDFRVANRRTSTMGRGALTVVEWGKSSFRQTQGRGKSVPLCDEDRSDKIMIVYRKLSVTFLTKDPGSLVSRAMYG
jgi:hypothetical protein